jgi:hypothetical protein
MKSKQMEKTLQAFGKLYGDHGDARASAALHTLANLIGHGAEGEVKTFLARLKQLRKPPRRRARVRR